MTGSEDHILGRFPRHPLPLAEQVGVGLEAEVDGVTSPCGNLDYIVPGGDEQAHVGMPEGVRRVPRSGGASRRAGAQYRKLGHITHPFVVTLSDLSVSWSWVTTPSAWRLQGVRDRCGHFCGQTREGGWYG